MREDEGPPRPVVTVTGGPAPARSADGEAPAAGRGGPALLLLAVVLLVGAAVLSRPTEPTPPPALSVDLALAPERISGSQSGVVLLPVDVALRGAEARLEDSLVWAFPVRSTSAVGGRTRFSPLRPGQVVVLVQPDCPMLRPLNGGALALTVELVFVGPQQQRARAALDLGADPAVAARVASLCRPPSDPAAVPPSLPPT